MLLLWTFSSPVSASSGTQSRTSAKIDSLDIKDETIVPLLFPRVCKYENILILPSRPFISWISDNVRGGASRGCQQQINKLSPLFAVLMFSSFASVVSCLHQKVSSAAWQSCMFEPFIHSLFICSVLLYLGNARLGFFYDFCMNVMNHNCPGIFTTDLCAQKSNNQI